MKNRAGGGIHYYCQHDEMPTMAFVPDATYPVVNVEKGIVHVRLLSSGKADAPGLEMVRCLKSWNCREATGLT